MTLERTPIVRKLRALSPLSSIAKRYWTRRKGGFQAVDVKPNGVGEAQWEEQSLITYGAARRGTGTEDSPNGLDVYKGENIRTVGIVCTPVFQQLDVWNLSSPSVWRNEMRNLLPDQMCVFAQDRTGACRCNVRSEDDRNHELGYGDWFTARSRVLPSRPVANISCLRLDHSAVAMLILSK